MAEKVVVGGAPADLGMGREKGGDKGLIEVIVVRFPGPLCVELEAWKRTEVGAEVVGSWN